MAENSDMDKYDEEEEVSDEEDCVKPEAQLSLTASVTQRSSRTAARSSRDGQSKHHGGDDDDNEHDGGDGGTPSQGRFKPTNRPVWDHTAVVDNKRICRHCEIPLSTHSTRIRRHLLEQCTAITQEEKSTLVDQMSRIGSYFEPRPRTTKGAVKEYRDPKTSRSYSAKCDVLEHTNADDDKRERSCRYCDIRLSWDHKTRIRRHLAFKCPNVPEDVKYEMESMETEPKRRARKKDGTSSKKKKKRASGSSSHVSDDDGSQSGSSDDSERKKTKGYSSSSSDSESDESDGERRKSKKYRHDYSRARRGKGSKRHRHDRRHNTQMVELVNSEPVCHIPAADVDYHLGFASMENGGKFNGGDPLPLSLDGLKDYMERLDQMIAGLCRVRTRVCRSILTRHRGETEFRNAVTDLKSTVDKGVKVNIIN